MLQGGAVSCLGCAGVVRTSPVIVVLGNRIAPVPYGGHSVGRTASPLAWDDLAPNDVPSVQLGHVGRRRRLASNFALWPSAKSLLVIC